jgi:hypothetical protein
MIERAQRMAVETVRMAFEVHQSVDLPFIESDLLPADFSSRTA